MYSSLHWTRCHLTAVLCTNCLHGTMLLLVIHSCSSLPGPALAAQPAVWYMAREHFVGAPGAAFCELPEVQHRCASL